MRLRIAFALLLVTACDCGSSKSARDASIDSAVDAASDGSTACTLSVPPLAAHDLVAGVTFPGALAVVAVPGSNDLAIVQQGGKISLVRSGAALPTPFLDLSSLGLFDDPSQPREQGLLGLAFHPDYASNGRFFVAHTLGDDPSTGATNERRNVIAEYARSAANPDVASQAEVARLVEVVDPEWNHNGGQLAFGPLGYLYAGLGDGGGGNDAGHGTCGNGLSTAKLLGKILRLDVDASANAYAAAGNPFSGASGLPQIALYGLRNPWRFSFDRATHDLWIADVGQDAWEELDFLAAGSALGVNYGWARFEGTHATGYVASATCDALASNAVAPIADFSHSTPNVLGLPHAIVGGYVYRGSAIPSLTGIYLFGDAITNQVAAARRCGDGSLLLANVADLSNLDAVLASFGEDANGELYMAFVGSGRVLAIGPRP